MKKNSASEWILLFSLAWAAIGLLLFPKEISDSVRDGLRLCTDVLMPTLFPFFILSSFLVSSGVTKRAERFLSKFMQPLFRLPGSCAAPVLLGALGGYPTGAKAAIALYQSGQCTKGEAERLLSFCNNCGPAFLLSGVGYTLFGSVEYGALLVCTHLAAAFLTGIIFSGSAKHKVQARHVQTNETTSSITVAFVSSVKDSMHSFLDLSAFVLCFSAISKLILLSGLLTSISPLLPLSGGNSEYTLLGLLEMTGGVMNLTAGSVTERLILSAALLGWGGLSVHFQVISLMHNTDLSPSLYFKGKAAHALLAAVLTAAVITDPRYLWLFALPLFIPPVQAVKKAVEKRFRVYYNTDKEIKPRELWYDEPVPEKNRTALRLLRPRKESQ